MKTLRLTNNMATTTEHLSVNCGVTDELLVTVADKLCPQHLQIFATTLIGLDAAEYNDILRDAEDDPGKQGIKVSYIY